LGQRRGHPEGGVYEIQSGGESKGDKVLTSKKNKLCNWRMVGKVAVGPVGAGSGKFVNTCGSGG